MNFLKGIVCLSLLSLSFAGASPSVAAQTSDATHQDLQQRVEQLELQIQTMRDELIKLKSKLSANDTPSTGGAATNASAVSTSANPSTAPAANQRPQATTVEKHPTGIDLGPVRAVPYGTIYFNAFGNSGGTNNADDPLFATPTNQGNVSMSVRQTRLGLKLEGPTIWHAKSRGQVEADFFGGFPAVGVGENFGIVRLRLAFVRLDWEKASVEAGQDWMVFAPNNPVSIAAAAIPQMAAAGNPWSRLPQIRLERRWASGRVLWQGAVLAPSTGDSPTATTSPFFLQPTTGAASRVPFFQSRVAFSNANWLDMKKAGSVGLSAHYGRARVANINGNNQIDSLGVAADWKVSKLVINFYVIQRRFARRRASPPIDGVPDKLSHHVY